MIKENKEKNRKDTKKELIKELAGYFKTAALSFIAAAIFTILLSFHARSEMIKNLYVNKKKSNGKVDMVVSLINAIYLLQQDVIFDTGFVVQT